MTGRIAGLPSAVRGLHDRLLIFRQHLRSTAEPQGRAQDHVSPAVLLERPDLIDNRDRRRVCFDPRSNVDSEFVEYFGFGHPIIDELEYAESSPKITRVRRPSAKVCEGIGWVGNSTGSSGCRGARGRSSSIPVFIADDGNRSRRSSADLFESSRRFGRRSVRRGRSCIEPRRGPCPALPRR